MEQGRMNALKFRDVVRVGNVNRAKILGTEPGETLFSDGDADFLHTIDVRNFGEDFFLLCVECEKSQILCVEQT